MMYKAIATALVGLVAVQQQGCGGTDTKCAEDNITAWLAVKTNTHDGDTALEQAAMDTKWEAEGQADCLIACKVNAGGRLLTDDADADTTDDDALTADEIKDLTEACGKANVLVGDVPA